MYTVLASVIFTSYGSPYQMVLCGYAVLKCGLVLAKIFTAGQVIEANHQLETPQGRLRSSREADDGWVEGKELHAAPVRKNLNSHASAVSPEE